MSRRGYAKFKNDFYLNGKARELRAVCPTALGAFVFMVTYCSDNLTDGRISDRDLHYVLGVTDEEIDALCTVGMLEPDGNEGFVVHDYTDHNSLRAEVQKKREQSSENYKKRRFSSDSSDIHPEKSELNRTKHKNTRTQEYINTPYSPPRGDHSKKDTQPRTPIPPDWQPDEAAQVLAREYQLDIDKSAEKFRLWAEAKGGRLADWDKRFRLWLIGEHQYARGQPAKTPTPTPDKHVSKPHRHSPGCEHVTALLEPHHLSRENTNGFGSSSWIQAASTLADQLNQGINATQALQTALKEAT